MCDIYKTHNIYIYMHDHTLFISHTLTYDFLRILPFLEIWIAVSVVGVGNILFEYI